MARKNPIGLIKDSVAIGRMVAGQVTRVAAEAAVEVVGTVVTRSAARTSAPKRPVTPTPIPTPVAKAAPAPAPTPTPKPAPGSAKVGGDPVAPGPAVPVTTAPAEKVAVVAPGTPAPAAAKKA
ncbi:MAG: hypothetical protein ABI776_12885, partial [Nocardioidaceae bacterium]